MYRPCMHRVGCPSDEGVGTDHFVLCKLHGDIIAGKREQKEERKIVILLLKHNI